MAKLGDISTRRSVAEGKRKAPAAPATPTTLAALLLSSSDEEDMVEDISKSIFRNGNKRLRCAQDAQKHRNRDHDGDSNDDAVNNNSDDDGDRDSDNNGNNAADDAAEEDDKQVGIQQSSSGKWYGQVSDTAHSAQNPGGKHKTRVTKCFATRAEAVEARRKLKLEVEAEYEAIITGRIMSDPLVRDLPRAPADPSKAVRRQAYCVCSYNTKHVPRRMVIINSTVNKRGSVWQLACVHCPVDDASVANTDKRVVATEPSCVAHGGVCEHERDPSVCRQCQASSDKQPVNLCSHCRQTRITRKRQITADGNGLCPACETHLKNQAAESGAPPPDKGKKWEDLVLDKLVTMVTDTHGNVISYEMRDDKSNMFGSNRYRRRGQCSTTHQRRPDILWLVRDADGYIAAAVMVEVDENSHTERDSVCEGGKIHDTFQCIVKLAQEEGRTNHRVETRRGEILMPQVIFIRFNPNACDVPGGGSIRLNDRIQVLAARVRELLNTPAEVYRQRSRDGQCEKPYLEILYYHTKLGGHHLAYYNKHKDTGFHLTPNRCPRPESQA